MIAEHMDREEDLAEAGFVKERMSEKYGLG